MQVTHNSLITVNQRVQVANDVLNDWATSNVYVLIGHEAAWTDNDELVDVPNQKTDYINSVYRNSVGMKKITAADMALVIPRVDWQTGVVYDQYDSSLDMFTTLALTATTGTVNVSNSRTLLGTNTTFTSQYTTGDFVYLPGDGEDIEPQKRQVVDVLTNASMNVNTAFTGQFTNNVAYKLEDSYPNYANQFYVRNAYDQVFKCLFNNFGATSTEMPQISLGGQSPENAFIVTGDGYKWKYLYTIPSGQKQKFFTSDWMPVYSNPTVVAAATDGAIDIIEVFDGGTGYNQNVASNTATIISIIGDGVNANVTAQVNAIGKILDISVLDSGQGYTYANVVIDGGLTGHGANIRAVISPPGGHGFNPIEELGATSLMLSLDIVKGENGTIPTIATVGTDVFDYRQISVLKNPKLRTGNVASNTNYSTVSVMTTQNLPAGQFFSMDETVFQGNSLAEATFVGTAVFWDGINNRLHLNNLSGSFAPLTPIRGTQMTTPVTAFTLIESVIRPYTGRILYVNNVKPVVRSEDQTEQIKLILSF